MRTATCSGGIEVLGVGKPFWWGCAELPYLSCVTARSKTRLRAPAASCRQLRISTSPRFCRFTALIEETKKKKPLFPTEMIPFRKKRSDQSFEVKPKKTGLLRHLEFSKFSFEVKPKKTGFLRHLNPEQTRDLGRFTEPPACCRVATHTAGCKGKQPGTASRAEDTTGLSRDPCALSRRLSGRVVR